MAGHVTVMLLFFIHLEHMSSGEILAHNVNTTGGFRSFSTILSETVGTRWLHCAAKCGRMTACTGINFNPEFRICQILENGCGGEWDDGWQYGTKDFGRKSTRASCSLIIAFFSPRNKQSCAVVVVIIIIIVIVIVVIVIVIIMVLLSRSSLLLKLICDGLCFCLFIYVCFWHACVF